MTNSKKCISFLLASIITASLVSCASDNTTKQSETEQTTSAETTAETTAEILSDDLGDFDFGGDTFTVAIFDNINVNNDIDADSETGDVLNDAIYKRNLKLEDRFNVVIEQTTLTDGEMASYVRKSIQSADQSFDAANVRCTDGLTFWQEGLITTIDKVPNIDLQKPYWNIMLNKSLTINNIQYIALGDFNVNTSDVTHALLFNKTLTGDLNLPDMYQTVRDGGWTYDEMNTVMTAAVSDLNGDSVMDDNDRWGYLAHPKEVLPSFWISAGVYSVAKDENDTPVIGIDNENFYDVFNKIFEITWDSGAWFTKGKLDADIPLEFITMFSNGQSLFMDTTFFVIGKIRDMETDFGIIPYPKFDADQKDYITRVEYYFPTIIPISSTSLEMTGVMLEALNCESANIVKPAYYDIALKTKYTRDDESSEMLDIIFNSRVVDMGDTTLCDKIRDSFMAQMFTANNRNLSSKVKTTEKIIESLIKKIPGSTES
jgi:hypothetical protein